MILSDSEILREKNAKNITIIPFSDSCLNPNSYDLHLSENLAEYECGKLNPASGYLDSKQHNRISHYKIPKEGIILYPNRFYLGSTLEYTETLRHVPFLEGKSSTGRLGIDIHATAGKGDVGFCGHWTLEISVKQRVRVYAGMPIGQIIYFDTKGEVALDYKNRGSSKYRNQGNLPVESMMWKNKF